MALIDDVRVALTRTGNAIKTIFDQLRGLRTDVDLGRSETITSSRLPGFAGDATAPAGSNAITLATVNSNVGTFGNSTVIPAVTVDAKGRITAVSSVALSIATSIAWTNVTGRPTTLSGYAITASDVLNTVLTVDGASSALDADLLDGQHGSFYQNASSLNAGTLATTLLPAFTGDASSPLGSSALTLATVNSNIGTFGNAVAAPIITVNAKGLITAVSTTPILSSVTWTNVTSKPTTLAGYSVTASDVLTTLLTVDGPASALDADLLDGAHGSFYQNASSLNAGTISGARMPAYTGDVTAAAGTTALTLATVNSNIGTFGNAVAAPIITVNAKGLITSVTTTPIISSVTWSNVTGTPTTLTGYGITDALPITGGVLTGNLTLSADPSSNLHAATKQYVDGLVQGLNPKKSVRFATTDNITLSGLQTIDGVLAAVGNRALVKNQSTPSQNGLYVVASGSWTRSTDADSWAEIISAYVFVEEGGQADSGWTCTVDSGGTLGSTSVTWIQFSGAGTYTASNGIIRSGSDFQLTGQALSLHNLVSTGFIRRTGVNTFSASAISNSDLPTSGATAGTYRTITVNDRGIVTEGSNPDISIANVTNLQTTLNAKADLVDGKLSLSQVPSIAITDVFVVASEVEMLALTAQRGDVAKRTDISTTFILSTESPATLADWIRIEAPGATAIIDTFVGNSVQTIFTLSQVSAPTSVLVTINGLVQRYTDDYTISGSTLTFVGAPFSGANIAARFVGIQKVDGVELGAVVANAISELGLSTPFYQSFIANGVQSSFLLAHAINSQDYVIVTLDGLVQRPGTDYTITSGVLNFAFTPANAITIAARQVGTYFLDGDDLEDVIANAVGASLMTNPGMANVVMSPSTVTSNTIAMFDGTSGKLIKQGANVDTLAVPNTVAVRDSSGSLTANGITTAFGNGLLASNSTSAFLSANAAWISRSNVSVESAIRLQNNASTTIGSVWAELSGGFVGLRDAADVWRLRTADGVAQIYENGVAKTLARQDWVTSNYQIQNAVLTGLALAGITNYQPRSTVLDNVVTLGFTNSAATPNTIVQRDTEGNVLGTNIFGIKATPLTTNSDDWNTFVTEGHYHVTGSGVWTGGSNGPTTAHAYGILEVMTQNTATQVIQRYTTNENPARVWIRTRFSGTWQAWTCLATTDDTVDITVNGIAPDGGGNISIPLGTQFTLSGTTNGAMSTVTLPYSDLTANTVELSINGILQYPTSDYTVSGTTLTFIPTPAAGLDYFIRGAGNFVISGTNLTSIVGNSVNALVGPSLSDIFITGTGNGVMTAVTLPYPDVTALTLLVSVNGIIQRPTTDYTVSGTVLNFTSPPLSGDVYAIRGQGNFVIDGNGLNTLIDNAVAGVTDVTQSWFYN